MRKLKLLFLLCVSTVGGALSVSAQTDVTSTYLTNASFDDGETGWTFNGSGTTYHGVAAYGSSTAINSATNINVDKFGKNTGNAAFSNAGWGDKSYYTQEVTLPAGSYKLTFDVINRFSSKTGINANYFGWVPNSGDAVYSTTKTFEYNVWYTLSVTFTITESTTGKISCGMQSISGKGSGEVAKLFIDNVKIFKTDEASAPTIANPIDYSDLINQTTWSVKQDDNATPTTSSALVTNITNGDWTGRYVERYRGVAGHYGKALYQTVSVPAGVYQVQAACMSSSANGVDAAAGKKDGDLDVAYFYANSEELTYPLSDKKGYFRKHIVTLDADGTIEFGINTKVVGANWNAIGCATVVKVANDYDSYIEDLLSASVAAWNTAHTTLANLDATLLPDAAEQAITEELAKARPNTQEAMESATAAMQALIDSYDGIKAAYDEYKVLKAQIIDLKNDSKYTFTGAEALSTFNSTLSTIDASAEAATDAATLTAQLPSLKTAGNTFVGAIDSNDGFDLTYNVENNSFETGALSPWTTNGSNDTGVRENSNGTYTTTGVDGDYLFNTWNNGVGSKVSQAVAGLPNGYYTVTALVASDAGNAINILAGATTKTIDADGTGKTQFVEGTTDKTLVSDGSLEIGTNSTTWYKSDYFRLTYYTVKAGAAEAWAAAKAAAEAARDDAAYVNVTGAERTALLAEIAKEEPSTAETYGTATTALQEATSAFIAAKDSYDALIAMRTTGETYTTVAWPRASAAKKTALDDAIAAEPTDAADAVTKTNAIVTAYRQFVESNGLAEGVDVAVNKTSELLVTDASVSTSGWTSGSIGTNTNEGYTDGAGNVAGKYFDGGWSNTAGVNITLTQNLTLPAGQYQLQITARGSDQLTSYTMSIGGESVDLPTESSTGGTFGRGWSDKYVTFESDGSELTLTIAATSTEYYQWISFNRLRLVKLDATLADATDYSALADAISDAEANLGFEDGQYAPYNNVESMTLLAAAKAINPTTNNVQKDVQDATTALEKATWTANDGDVDAIYNGAFAESNGWNPKGWTRSNNAWGQQITGLNTATNGVDEGTTTAWYYNSNGAWEYGKDDIYTMPLVSNQAYVLSFKYSKHNSDWQSWLKASVLNDSDEGLEVVQFPGADDGTTYKHVKAYFTTGAAGNYILSIEQNGNAHLTDVSLIKAASSTKNISENDDAVAATVLTYYETVALTRTLSADYWNTFSVPFDAAIPEGWSVYEFASAEDNVINFAKVTTSFEAGKPYLVKPTDDVVNPTFNNVIVKSTEGSTDGTGDYKFAAQIYKKNLATDGTIAYLATDGSVKKLNKADGLKGLRAYFIIPAGGSGARISFGDDETTGITDVRDLKDNARGDIYDLQGRKVTTPTKGIYVVNGKKVVKK